MSRDKAKLLFALTFVVLLGIALYGLGAALGPMIFSFAMAYLLRPLTGRLERWGIPRTVSVGVVFLLSTAILVLIGILLVPILLREFRNLILSLPALADLLFTHVDSFLQEYGYSLPIQREELHSFIQQTLSKSSLDLLQSATPLLTNTFSSLIQIVLLGLNLALVPVFFAFFVHQYESIRKGFFSLVPLRYRNQARAFGSRLQDILQGYIYGQLLVMLILATFYGLGLLAVGLKYGLLIGILTGLLVIVPYVGFTLGLVTAAIVGFAHFTTWTQFLLIYLVFGLGQALESFLVTPWLVGQKVGLSPLTTILALIIGGNLFGFVGLLVAVPSAAIVQEILRMLRLEYRKSRFFLD